MQTLGQIRSLLEDDGLAPQKRLGQCFLVDRNLMGKLLELAELTGDETVLEVGPGTGSLTEELLDRAARVVAVEIDRGLHALLARRLADRADLTLLHGDVLAGKHAIAPDVLQALPAPAHLVANLPYNIATPLVADCLLCSWSAARTGPARFERLTFTVQKEVADRIAAGPNSNAYGPISVIVGLLGTLTTGTLAPNTAFWPRPKVASRMLRIDFDPSRAAALDSAPTLRALLSLTFGHRRKQIHTAAKRKDCPYDPAAFGAALATAAIDPAARAENVALEQYLVLANALAPDGP